MTLFVVVFNALLLIGGCERRKLESRWVAAILALLPEDESLGRVTARADTAEAGRVIDLSDLAYVDDVLSFVVFDDIQLIRRAARIWEVVVGFGGYKINWTKAES